MSKELEARLRAVEAVVFRFQGQKGEEDASICKEAADTLERQREALEAIRNEAERENGRRQHLKRCIAVQAGRALSEEGE